VCWAYTTTVDSARATEYDLRQGPTPWEMPPANHVQMVLNDSKLAGKLRPLRIFFPNCCGPARVGWAGPRERGAHRATRTRSAETDESASMIGPACRVSHGGNSGWLVDLAGPGHWLRHWHVPPGRVNFKFTVTVQVQPSELRNTVSTSAVLMLPCARLRIFQVLHAAAAARARH
jgi:hypothetical protein